MQSKAKISTFFILVFLMVMFSAAGYHAAGLTNDVSLVCFYLMLCGGMIPPVDRGTLAAHRALAIFHAGCIIVIGFYFGSVIFSGLLAFMFRIFSPHMGIYPCVRKRWLWLSLPMAWLFSILIYGLAKCLGFPPTTAGALTRYFCIGLLLHIIIDNATDLTTREEFTTMECWQDHFYHNAPVVTLALCLTIITVWGM